MTHPVAMFLVVILAIAYGVQFLISLAKLDDNGFFFERYKSQGEFWFFLLVPILPVMLAIISQARRIGK